MAGGMYGVGGFGVASYLMVKMNHEMRGARNKLVDGVKLRRAHGHDETSDGLLHIDREEFECFFLCRVCGYLSQSDVGRCPSCRREAWIDLGDNRVAGTLSELEDQQRREIPGWIKGVVAGIYAALATVLGVVVGVVHGPQMGVTVGIVSLPVVGLLYLLTLRLWAVVLERLNRKRPTRWRLPLPLTDFRGRPDRHTTGLAEGEQQLTAPFTGRPCLGYKTMIKFDVAGDARPPEWVLAEVVSADFAAGGVEVEAERTVIDTEIEMLDEIQLDPDFDLERFLRQRGLYAYDGDFFLYEARVEPGDPISISVYDGERPTAVVRAA